MIEIAKSVVDGLPFDLTEAVKEYAVARSMHALTVNQPAPTAHPIVEAVVHAGGKFKVVDDPEPVPTAAEEDAVRMSETLLAQQNLIEEMRTAMRLQEDRLALLEQNQPAQINPGLGTPVEHPHDPAIEVQVAPEGGSP